jgi:hypothetical protein
VGCILVELCSVCEQRSFQQFLSPASLVPLVYSIQQSLFVDLNLLFVTFSVNLPSTSKKVPVDVIAVIHGVLELKIAFLWFYLLAVAG